MADLFGAPSGITQGIQDVTYMQKAPLELQKLGQEVQQGNITTQTMQMDLMARKKMMEAMGQLGTNMGEIKNPADLSDVLGGIWLRAGDPDKAMKAFADAEGMRNHAANTAAALGRKKLEDITAHDKMLNYEVGQLQGVNSQEELDALNARLEAQTGEPVPWAGRPYSPQLKDDISKTLLTASQQMKLDLDKDKLSWQKEYQSALLSMREAGLRLAKDRETRLKHAATIKDGKVAEPTAQQVNQASSIIRLAHPSFITAPEDMQLNISTKVAEKAHEIMTKNKGLRYTEAAQQAMSDPSIQSDLKTIADAKFSGSVWNKLRGATPPETEDPTTMQGQAWTNPAPLPDNVSDMTEGTIYYNKEGRPAIYKKGPYGLGLYEEGVE